MTTPFTLLDDGQRHDVLATVEGGGVRVAPDALHAALGWQLKPETVFAQTWTIPPQFAPNAAPDSDAETYYHALVRCEGNTVLALERGEYMPCANDAAWQIIGTKGALKPRMIHGNPKQVLRCQTTTEEGVATDVLWEGDEEMQRVHDGPVLDFAAAIREGREPMTSLENALIIAQITDAVYASAESGTAVEID